MLSTTNQHQSFSSGKVSTIIIHQRIIMYFQLIAAIPLILMALNGAVATKHSQCYAWYHHLDGANGIRSNSTLTAKLLTREHLASSKSAKLVRRITPSSPSKFVAGGDSSACGAGYNTETVLGACLWVGNNQQGDLFTSGWLTGMSTTNCYKHLYIVGGPQDTKVEGLSVIDACGFGDNISVDEGCSTIWLTERAFIQSGGDPNTMSELQVKAWDFYSNSPPY